MLLNYAGVLLYELGEIAAAERSSTPLPRSTPTSSTSRTNRKAARAGAASRRPPSCPGQLGHAARAAGARAPAHRARGAGRPGA